MGAGREGLRPAQGLRAALEGGRHHPREARGAPRARARLGRRVQAPREGPGRQGERRVRRADGAPGLVRRRLEADGPDRARSVGIAYARTCRGRLHLAVVMGMWPRGTAGRPMGGRVDAGPADGAPRMAIARRRPPGDAPATATTARGTPPSSSAGRWGTTGSARRRGRWGAPGTTRRRSRSWAS